MKRNTAKLANLQKTGSPGLARLACFYGLSVYEMEIRNMLWIQIASTLQFEIAMKNFKFPLSALKKVFQDHNHRFLCLEQYLSAKNIKCTGIP